MTLNRLRAIAVILPIAAVIGLEIARLLIIGLVSWEKRLALDLVFVASIVVFSAIIFRYTEVL